MNEPKLDEPSESLVMTADDITIAVANWLPWWRYLVVPNVTLFPVSVGEMDIAALSRANMLYEVEVKVSFADWKADFKKAKWIRMRERGYDSYSPSRFSFAVPQDLLDTRGLPNECPDWAGILSVSARTCYDETRLSVKEIRKPRMLHRRPIALDRILELAHKATHRHWRRRLNGGAK